VGAEDPLTKMPCYLVESYAAGSVVDDQRERARRAGEVGTGVRYVRTTFLPGDETVLHVFEASSPEALREAARVAALPYERIVEAVEGSGRSRRRRA
jgi:Nickel responsive protein SCO4226-like